MKLSSIGLRVVPFILTFAAGLLIASIFVPISAPSFKSSKSFNRESRYEKYRKHKDKCKRKRSENADLRFRIQQLEAQNEELKRMNDIHSSGIKLKPELQVLPPEVPVNNARTISVPIN